MDESPPLGVVHMCLVIGFNATGVQRVRAIPACRDFKFGEQFAIFPRNNYEIIGSIGEHAYPDRRKHDILILHAGVINFNRMRH